MGSVLGRKTLTISEEAYNALVKKRKSGDESFTKVILRLASKDEDVVYRADPGRIEIVKIPGLREAYSRRKIAKVTFEEFENMTGEALGE